MMGWNLNLNESQQNVAPESNPSIRAQTASMEKVNRQLREAVSVRDVLHKHTVETSQNLLDNWKSELWGQVQAIMKEWKLCLPEKCRNASMEKELEDKAIMYSRTSTVSEIVSHLAYHKMRQLYLSDMSKEMLMLNPSSASHSPIKKQFNDRGSGKSQSNAHPICSVAGGAKIHSPNSLDDINIELISSARISANGDHCKESERCFRLSLKNEADDEDKLEGPVNVVVIRNFKKRFPEELSLKTGEIIYGCIQNTSSIVFGMKHKGIKEKSGYFPRSCVEPLPI